MKPLEILGLSGLYLFSFTAVLGIAGANIGLLLMLIAMLPQLPEVWARLRDSVPFRMILVGVVGIVLAALIASYQLPETATHQWGQALRWGDIIWLPVVAWWLRSEPKHFYIAFALFAAGAIIRMFYFMPWDDFYSLLIGDYHPYGFGLWHIPFSAYLVVILMGVVFFSQRLILSGKNNWIRSGMAGLLLLVALICIEGILVGKSRGTWIAVLLVMPVSLIFYLQRFAGSMRGWLRYSVVGVGLLAPLALVGVILLSQKEGIMGRVLQEQDIYLKILEGDLSRIPETSIGTRIHLWYYGIEQWLDKPVLGWGPGSEKYLIAKSGIAIGGVPPPHFHNTYIEILVRFGLVGFLFTVVLLWLVYRDIWKRYRAGQLPADWFYFLFSVMAFCLIWSFFNSRFMRWDYRDFTLLFLGVSFAMTQSLTERSFFVNFNPERP